MLRKIVISSILIFTIVSLSFADKTCVIDTPNVNMLDCDSYNVTIKFLSGGTFVPSGNFSIFKWFNIGGSLELGKLIGKGDEPLKVAIPAFQVKFKVYEGNMTYPAIAIGFDGQGYFFDSGYSWDYLQKGRGIYLVIGREFFVENLMFNIGANINIINISNDDKIHGFINLVVPLFREIIYLVAECDNIIPLLSTRVNLGLRFALTEFVNIDCIVRDCCLGLVKMPDDGRLFNERIIRISHSFKF
ncbi:MAG: hypothetical protein LBR09_00665 [Endomicrobium sp.]|jgi:hypothetical protein|nr:hypothetical protein [Endomicrobium sp.]